MAEKNTRKERPSRFVATKDMGFFMEPDGSELKAPKKKPQEKKKAPDKKKK